MRRVLISYLKFLAVAALVVLALALALAAVRFGFGMMVRYPQLTGLAILAGIVFFMKGILAPAGDRRQV